MDTNKSSFAGLWRTGANGREWRGGKNEGELRRGISREKAQKAQKQNEGRFNR